jgi:hypothetical protein
MAAGSDARIGIAAETTFLTRVAPTRFIAVTGESFAFTRDRAFSNAIGTGRWARPSRLTNKGGTGSLTGEVPTVGFGFLVNSLHSNTVTPVQQGATAAYLQTHTLDTPITRPYSIQVQMPPTNSATLTPHDLLGVMFGGLNLAWSDGNLVTYELPGSVGDLSTAQSLATYTAPPAYEPYAFGDGSIMIGGSLEANIVGDGSLALNFGLRTDAHALGLAGVMAKPVENAKPTAEGNFTADFVDNTNVTRMLQDTTADVVVRFQHPTAIAATYFPYVEVTLPNCKFTTSRPTVSGPGLVDQPVTFTASSSTNTPVVIRIQSSEVTL